MRIKLRIAGMGVHFFSLVQKMAAEEAKFNRDYPRVPGLDEVDKNDLVGVQRAKDQYSRDRYATCNCSSCRGVCH